MIFDKINRQLRKINRKRKRAHISTAEGIMLGLMVTLTAVSYTVTASDIIANTEPVVVTELSSVDDSLSEEPELMDDEEVMVVFTTIPNVEDDEELQVCIDSEARLQKTLEEKIADQMEEERIRKEQERIEKINNYINSIVCDPSDVSRVSNLNKEDYCYLTEGTWWEGHEDTLYDLEKNHGISALFAMSVSTLESAGGTSIRASSKHNYYGIELPTVWNGLYDNTQWWGNLIKESYVGSGYKSVWQIGPKYCPPNRDWESYHNDKMHELYNNLISRLKETYL